MKEIQKFNKMKKFIQYIKNLWLNLYLSDGLIQYSFLKIYNENKNENSILNKYIEKIAKEIAEIEGINIYNTPFDELNKDETNEDNKAVGVFKYIKNEDLLEYKEIVNSYMKQHGNWDFGKKYNYPRIEITEKGDVYTILHELGHYFLYKRNIEQSEQGANDYIEEFFNNHLPSFFKWIFQINIKIRIKKEIEFSNIECYNYLKDYKIFMKDLDC